jgi:hypothetical protein
MYPAMERNAGTAHNLGSRFVALVQPRSGGHRDLPIPRQPGTCRPDRWQASSVKPNAMASRTTGRPFLGPGRGIPGSPSDHRQSAALDTDQGGRRYPGRGHQLEPGSAKGPSQAPSRFTQNHNGWLTRLPPSITMPRRQSAGLFLVRRACSTSHLSVRWQRGGSRSTRPATRAAIAE